MSPRLSRRQAERRGLRLWPVGTVLVLAFATAVLVAAAVFYTGWDLLGASELKPERRIDSKTLFELVKLSFGVVAGAGALVALVVAYRRQRVDEDGALRDATRLHTERFTTAVSQLGDESAAVRLGGVHALAGLADDAPTRDLRQTCIDVLCAYLRLPYSPEADLPANHTEARHSYLALREVRHTVIRLIRDHLRLPADHHHSWQNHSFDFTGVIFDGGDFSEATFPSGCTVNFDGSTFSGGRFDFHMATFSGGKVSFREVTFSGGVVVLEGATFSEGEVDFGRARFSGGVVDLSWALFSGGSVNFPLSTFSDGRVNFCSSSFTGGTVDFHKSAFTGSTVDFSNSLFDDGVVNFDKATFSDGRVTFDSTTLAGTTVTFHESSFSGGTVTFARAIGKAPSDLVQTAGFPLVNGLVLPAAWQPAGS